MKKLFVACFSVTLMLNTVAQEDKKASTQLEFVNEIQLDATPVKSQDLTGTCWSYSSISFIESEILRMGNGSHDLSEMYYVYNIYQEKAANYVLRQGKAQFSQGSLNHDVIGTIAKYGVVPQSVYSGDVTGGERYNHTEMEALLGAFLEKLVTNPNGKLSTVWMDAYRGILNAYMGQTPRDFEYNGKTYTPTAFAEELELKPENYVAFTSFSHHPFNTSFVLEVPDNWSNGSFYNLPLDELMEVLNNALKNGYTVAWDADVSEKTWSRKKDIARWPAQDWKSMSSVERDSVFIANIEEADVTQEKRQEAFENYSTTDDHLMHIVGNAYDQYGNLYYLVKNSWGDHRANDGYVYVSEAYMRMKTISFTLHKDGLAKSLLKKIN